MDGMQTRALPAACFAALALLLVEPVGYADFESASAAYQRQEFNAVFQEFLQLAKQGDARSQTVIAMMYKYGESVAQDSSEAANWYEKAAEQGYSIAQYHLGTLYSEERGVPQDRDEAIRWLTLASEGGFERANDALFALNVTIETPTAVSDPTIPWSQKWDLSLPQEVTPAAVQPRPANPTQKALPRPTESGTSEASKIRNEDGFGVQLGAFSRVQTAEQLVSDLRYAEPDLFDRPASIVPPEPGNREIYRLQIGGMNSRTDADSFCATLKARHPRAACIVLLPR